MSRATVVEKSGAWYGYNGERIGQGKDNSRQYLRENPAIAAKLESELHAAETADGLDHSADAELKAFRTLERELKEAKVAAGGQLRVRVSKIPCESCRKVFARFADRFGMS